MGLQSQLLFRLKTEAPCTRILVLKKVLLRKERAMNKDLMLLSTIVVAAVTVPGCMFLALSVTLDESARIEGAKVQQENDLLIAYVDQSQNFKVYIKDNVSVLTPRPSTDAAHIGETPAFADP